MEELILEKEENVQKVKEQVKKYTQKWPEYNEAQTQEKLICLQLMEELLGTLNQIFIKRTGRPRFPFKDLIICMFTYVYNNFSSRRTISDIHMLKKWGVVKEVPHFNTILVGFKNRDIQKVLASFITIASIPLKPYEKCFAVDSSGFSTSIFERWLDLRTQKSIKVRHWKKAHILIGTKTNTVIDVRITNGTGADCSHLIPLLETSSMYFSMEELSADKAYLSRDNLQAMAERGIVPFIPFKTNSAHKNKGCSIWSQMFKLFYTNYDEFARHYHCRSNVESTFHMVKMKFSHKLKTRTDQSQINEILMKFLCHNLAVLVQESFELGLEVNLKKSAEHYYALKSN